MIELLVSMAVLLVIFATCTALILTVQKMFNYGHKKMDADGQARLVFDRLSSDLASMIKRTDVDYIVKDGTQTQVGNDSLAFYTKASGYFTTDPDPAPRKTLSLVAYRINQNYQLERLAKGIGWNGVSSEKPMAFKPATLFGTWPTIAGGTGDLNLGTDTDYQVLAEGVFRFEYCYILRDGSYSNVPYLSPDTDISGWQDVVALYAAIAVLDEQSRTIVPKDTSNNPALTPAITAFGDFNLSSGSYPPLTQWESVMNQSNFSSLVQMPPQAAQAIRVFARTIPVNNNAMETSP